MASAACGPGHVPRQDAALLSEASRGTFGWSLGGGWRAGAPGVSLPTRHHRSPHRLSANRPEQSSGFWAGRSQPPPWVGRARTPGRDLLTGGSSRGFALVRVAEAGEAGGQAAGQVQGGAAGVTVCHTWQRPPEAANVTVLCPQQPGLAPTSPGVSVTVLRPHLRQAVPALSPNRARGRPL